MAEASDKCRLGTQVIPSDWIEESTRVYSITERRLAGAGKSGGYGYLWWVDSYGLSAENFSAMGSLGRYLVVIPEREMVVVYLNHTDWPDNAPLIPMEGLEKPPDVSRSQIGKFVNLLLYAQHGPSAENHARSK